MASPIRFPSARRFLNGEAERYEHSGRHHLFP